MVKNEKGVFLEKCVTLPQMPGNKKLVILFPVLITYPLENDYLKSHFVASDDIPVSTAVVGINQRAADTYPVSLHDGLQVFNLQFNQHDIQKWIPDTVFVALLIMVLLASI